MDYISYGYMERHAGHDHDHDHGDHDHDHANSSAATFLPKVTAMLTLGLLSFFFSIVPLLFKLKQKNREFKSEEEKIRAKKYEDRTISLLMSFCGGVLFCTIFIHVLPEVEEIFEAQLKKINIVEWEILPQLLMCAGFFMMYIIEELTHYCMHNCGCNTNESVNIDHVHNIDTNLNLKTNQNQPGSDWKLVQEIIDRIDEKATNLTFDERQNIIDSVRQVVGVKPPEYQLPTETSIPVREIDVNASNSCDSHGQGHHDHSHLSLTGSSAVRSFLFALALSVHELFEGLSIGLQERPAAVWYMLFGVGAHKLVLAFCMGVEMIAGDVKMSLYIAYAMMFAAVSPTGIACGIILSSGEGIMAAVFQGIACGTLLYVLFFEILRRETHVSGIISCILVICGFFMMFGLRFIEFN